MDSIFVEGLAATISAIIVFCGSVWLLLALVLGPRLSYFVTASITLGFLLMMGVVWSVGDTALGPVGELPSYTAVGAGDTPQESGFGPAGDFPEGGWIEANPEETEQAEIKTGAEGAAPDALEEAIEAGEVTAFERLDQASVDTDATRLFQADDGTFYAGVRFEPVPTDPEEEDAPGDQDIAPEGGDNPQEDDAAAEDEETIDENAEAYVFFEQDPGNELGEARMITVGFLVLFVLHLLGLSASERRARTLTRTS